MTDSPIAFALDVPNMNIASEFVTQLEDHVGAFKVGLELFISSGRLPATKRPVILDLKLHDIPATVGRAVKAGGNLGAKFMTMHIQQKAAIEEAVKAAEEFDGLTLLGVSVLTSMSRSDCYDLRYNDATRNPAVRAKYLVGLGYDHGLRGFVCSPQEVSQLKKSFPDTFFLVPGVRPAGADVGDQKRVGTPEQAVRDGASLIVVGRPIRDAADPVAAAKAINESCEG